MRVFVTGASGWIGSAAIPELLAHGHEVLGLARSDAAAQKVAAYGAQVLRGDVQDIDVLRAGAEQADGVAHLGFRHDIAWTGRLMRPPRRIAARSSCSAGCSPAATGRSPSPPASPA
jgi:nucleoside-diphosphate-sugar epimerase